VLATAGTSIPNSSFSARDKNSKVHEHAGSNAEHTRQRRPTGIAIQSESTRLGGKKESEEWLLN